MTTRTLPKIPLKTYRLYFDTTECVRLPDYPGSAWACFKAYGMRGAQYTMQAMPAKTGLRL